MWKDEYSHFQHRHNFAVWCAARAVQRKFAKTSVLKEAIEKCGVKEFIHDNEDKQITQEQFDELHDKWCSEVIKCWKENNVKDGSYGRAAKLIAVYIKAMAIVRNGLSELSMVAHPPIDRFVLQNISRNETIKHDKRTDWRKINWTELDKEKYLRLIDEFREVFRERPFWHLEQYWTITDE